jgi:hypothetical protein
MTAVRSSEYPSSRWTGLMRREGRSHAWVREEARIRVYPRYVFRDDVFGRLLRCSRAVGCRVMYFL